MSARRQFVAPHVAELPKSGIRAFFDIVAQRRDIVSLGVGEPDFDTPWHISRAAVLALEEGRTHYTSNLGTPDLRKAICDYLSRRFQATYDWAHEPCFVSYAPTVRLAHATPVAVETHAQDAFRLTVDALEAKVTPRTKALLVNFPCNPTGATLSREDMRAIADFCVRHDLILLADEVYSELVYDGEPVSFASFPDIRDRLILLNGFSKSWAMTGFRLGYACGPAEVIDAMMKIHQYGIMSAPTLSQYAGVEAMERGDADVARMRAEYKRRRDFLVPALNAMGLPTVMPKGAFYIFSDIRASGLSSQDFALRLLNDHAVACVPGSAFGACGEGFVRMSYATSLAKIKLAVERISAFMQDLTEQNGKD